MKIHKPAAGLPAAVALAAVLAVGAAGALPALDAHLHDLRIRSVEQAGPPQLHGQEVLFSYEAERIPDFVGARFEHEQFRVLHPYARVPRLGQRPPIFVLVLAVPPQVDRLRYRIVVDGRWMADPFNPEASEEVPGERFSVFHLAERPETPLSNPTFLPDGTVRFSFRAQPGRRLAVVGEFNHWNPYWDLFQETAPGEYHITLRLPPGRHFYRFVLDGRRLLDPYNPLTARDPDGSTVSTFELPPGPAAQASRARTPPAALYPVPRPVVP